MLQALQRLEGTLHQKAAQLTISPSMQQPEGYSVNVHVDTACSKVCAKLSC